MPFPYGDVRSARVRLFTAISVENRREWARWNALLAEPVDVRANDANAAIASRSMTQQVSNVEHSGERLWPAVSRISCISAAASNAARDTVDAITAEMRPYSTASFANSQHALAVLSAPLIVLAGSWFMRPSGRIEIYGGAGGWLPLLIGGGHATCDRIVRNAGDLFQSRSAWLRPIVDGTAQGMKELVSLTKFQPLRDEPWRGWSPRQRRFTCCR